jgi:hypothetical protein
MVSASRLAPQRIACPAALGLCAALLPLTGCGIGTPAPPSAGDAVTLHGFVHGGNSPVDGAVMQLYYVGTGGNGSGAHPMITSKVVKSVQGAFNITGDYTCPALVNGISPPVYLAATGGNPGLTPGTNNPALALVAALGPCNRLYANAATTTININEATTAAAAWALAPFASVATSYTSIASSSTNLQGSTNAMLLAQQLADYTTGVSPGTAAPTGSVVESAKLYTLADILASCVNSTGADTNCSGLFKDVTPTNGTKPIDTFGAALMMVQNPGYNVANIFKNHVGTSPPFTALKSAPNDWTMTISYSPSIGPFANFTLEAFDTEGDFWGFVFDPGSFGEDITEINRQQTQLVSVALDPYTDGQNYETGPNGSSITNATLAIDGSQNVWVTSAFNANSGGADTNATGSVLKFGPSGNALFTSPGYTSGGIIDPVTIAADSNGLIWVGSSGSYDTAQGIVVESGGDVSALLATGAALSPATGFGDSSDFYPGVIAIDGNHTAWFSNYANAFGSTANTTYIVSVAAPTSANPSPAPTKTSIPYSYSSTLAVDTNNFVWFTGGNDYADQLGVIDSSGTLRQSALSGGGMVNASGMAIDPANNIWIADTNFAADSAQDNIVPVTISQFHATDPVSLGTAPGTVISPAQGYGTDPNLCTQDGTTLLIDSSGSLWVNAGPSPVDNGYNYCLGGVTAFVGLATPLNTPQLGPPHAP